MRTNYYDRLERQSRLLALLPPAVTACEQCPDVTHLLESLAEDYGKVSDSARRRALQRDLERLAKEERIEIANPRGKPLRYRRSRRREDDLTDDQWIWQETVAEITALAPDVSRHRQINRLWERLLNPVPPAGPVLDATRLRILPDTLRLQPAVVSPMALIAVITALAKGYALDVHYENAQGDQTKARIHPQALIQRGPLPYLFALKNEEVEPVRLYALHRLRAATALPLIPARQAEDFDLDEAIAEGIADFGSGELIVLELRVRGYLSDILQTCPLSEDQDEEDEPDGAAFRIRVTATVPSTGQLLRWLLGAGANVEVVAPPDLRQVVAVQAAKMADIYRTDDGR